MQPTGLCEFWLVCECVSPVMLIGSNPASLVWPCVCEPQHRQYVRAVTCSCGAINHLIPSFNLGQITVWAMGAPHPNTGWCALGRYGGRKNEPAEGRKENEGFGKKEGGRGEAHVMKDGGQTGNWYKVFLPIRNSLQQLVLFMFSKTTGQCKL